MVEKPPGPEDEKGAPPEGGGEGGSKERGRLLKFPRSSERPAHLGAAELLLEFDGSFPVALEDAVTALGAVWEEHRALVNSPASDIRDKKLAALGHEWREYLGDFLSARIEFFDRLRAEGERSDIPSRIKESIDARIAALGNEDLDRIRPEPDLDSLSAMLDLSRNLSEIIR